MLSDMICRGPFHHRSMTSGGRNTTPARMVQLNSDRGLPTMHTALAASAQTAANLTFICSSCMLEGYGTLQNAAVPKRTTRDAEQPRPRVQKFVLSREYRDGESPGRAERPSSWCPCNPTCASVPATART